MCSNLRRIMKEKGSFYTIGGLQNMNDKSSDDIYLSKNKVERYRKTLLRYKNGQTAVLFLDALALQNASNIRIRDYGYTSMRLLCRKDDTPMKTWTKEEIKQIVAQIVQDNLSNTTKRDQLRGLKRLIHFAKTGDLIVKGRNNAEYCEEVAWITPGEFKDRFEKIRSNDLVTNDEFMAMINGVKKISHHIKRDIALLYILYEASHRPAELLNMTVGDVVIKEKWCVISTFGKTGPKQLTVVPSFKPLLEWLNEHPSSDNPSAYLWFENNKTGRISYSQLLSIIRKSAKEGGVKKRIWPYLLRHTSLTNVEKAFGSKITDIHGNWTHGSNMRSRYVHLANSDQDKAVRKRYGLLTDKDEDEPGYLEPIACPRCTEENAADKQRCVKCGFILDNQIAQKIVTKEDAKAKGLERKVTKKVGNLELLFAKQQKLIEEQQQIITALVKEKEK